MAALACCLLGGLLGVLTPSLARAASPARLDISTLLNEQALAPALQTLEDPKGSLTLDAVQTSTAWQSLQGNALNFGFSRSTWWVRISLHNPTPDDQLRLLDLNSALIDRVDVTLIRGTHTLTTLRTGDRLPFASRLVPVRSLVMPVNLAPGETVTLYLRFQAHDGLHEISVPTLWQPPAFAAHTQTESLTFGLYYGLLITVLLYNLFLFVSTRDPGFGYYVAYIAAFFVWAFIFRGLACQYWWPDSPNFNNQILPVAANLAYITMGIFVMHYLQTWQAPTHRLHRLACWSLLGIALGSLPALFNAYALTFAISSVFGLVLIACLVGAGVKLLKAGSRPARYFALAFSSLAVGVVLYYLRVLGVVPANTLTDNFMQIGSAAEALLLAFGLADHMNTLKAQKLQAEQEALHAQTALTTELESLVSSRTTALELANSQLAALSMTDELTGVFNRRQFNKDLAMALSLHARHHTPMALCLLDVDHFKRYNDHYGHPAGDHVLQDMARALIAQLHRINDKLYRVGGEEFAILLDTTEPAEHTLAFVDQLVHTVDQLGLTHVDAPLGRVSISLGLVILTARHHPTPDPHALYAMADEMLYEAKGAGRNRAMSRTLD
jgi:diguanylate cyclase (GGDEF)-like protein